jgi:hypothetical protein
MKRRKGTLEFLQEAAKINTLGQILPLTEIVPYEVLGMEDEQHCAGHRKRGSTNEVLSAT